MLHIGGARTALFNWLYARHTGGKFLLRIEDTDRERSTPEAVAAILNGMRWLGLNWDGDEIYQFARADRHRQIAQQLLAEGKAYRCYATAEELAQMRAEQKASGKPMRYDGRWRERVAGPEEDGQPFVVRLKARQDGETTVHDRVLGDVRFDNHQLDDMVLLRSDGTPTYMLAVVVDDHDMGVTHVIRGADHLNNTARQMQILEQMGWPVPIYAHLPLINGPDGQKLSKRHGALGVDAYRKMGYLPEALRNYLARLGWSHGDDEIFSTEQMVEWFSLDGLNKGAARFDFVKLESVNGHYIRAAEPAYLYEVMLAAAAENERQADVAGLTANRETVLAALPELQPRAKTVLELIDLAQFIYAVRPIAIEPDAERQFTAESRQMLGAFKTVLEGLVAWSVPAIDAAAREFAEARGVKLGKVAQPLRAALTGRTISPGIFEVMVLIGRTESLARLGDQIL